MPADEDLDQSVRRSDPDRWLASRFIIDAAARADVIALLAFDHQLARAGRVTSNALIAEIRLTWWGEAVEEIYEGRPVRGHPVAQALCGAVRRRGLPRDVLDAMIEARITQPENAATLADAVDGSLALLAARILDASADADVARSAGRVYGLCRQARDGMAAIDLVAPLAEAARAVRGFSTAAFPAVACATLARARNPSPLETRVRLFWAVLSGRI